MGIFTGISDSVSSIPKQTQIYIGLGAFVIVVSAAIVVSMLTTPRCGYAVRVGFLYSEKQEVLDKHNELRSIVARGGESKGVPGPQPSAKSMPPLKWDAKISEGMQKYISKCRLGQGFSKNHDDSRFELGQNLAWRKGEDKKESLNAVIMMWYNESAKHPGYNVDQYSGCDRTFGRYTQMVWAKTKHLGCGLLVLFDGSEYVFSLGCRYGPAGNVAGKPIYEQVE